VGYLKGACHASFSTIRKFLRDVVGLPISRGQLAKLVQKVSASLRETYEQLHDALPDAKRLNVDETGHPDQGRRLWTWCLRADLYTVFAIDPSRGSDVLVRILGQEFDGLLGCDYFSAYRKYMRLNENVAVQFCLAHLIRDVKFLVEHPRRANRRYGKLLLSATYRVCSALGCKLS
jgi:GNAT superfamily N-acetyltransferase